MVSIQLRWEIMSPLRQCGTWDSRTLLLPRPSPVKTILWLTWTWGEGIRATTIISTPPTLPTLALSSLRGETPAAGRKATSSCKEKMRTLWSSWQPQRAEGQPSGQLLQEQWLRHSFPDLWPPDPLPSRGLWL